MKYKKEKKSGYYEPFGSYEGTKKLYEAFTSSIKVPMGMCPKTFMSASVPMGGKVGKKGK